MRCEYEKKFTENNFKGTIDFTEDKELKKKFKRSLGRFFKNPEKNWGPKSTAILKINKKKDNKDDEDKNKKIKIE